jgi:ABC-type transport system substrate-binding protein
MNTAVVIQDALRQIGIDMQIKPITGTAFDELAWDQRALEVSIHSMGPWWNDFMYWAYWMYRSDSATNHIQYSNARLDENVLEALLIPQDQEAAYMELQTPVLEIMLEERLAAPLYQVNWNVAHSKKICNINTFPWGQMAIEYMRACE